jgi:hypothetical protein
VYLGEHSEPPSLTHNAVHAVRLTPV